MKIEEEKHTFLGKTYKSGGSIAVIIPYYIRKKLGLREKQILKIKIEEIIEK